MNKVLKKRIFREFRANAPRYVALTLLIVMGMYIVVSLVAGAETIIARTAEYGSKNKVEDGQFELFVPLTAEQEKELTDKGVLLEKMFHLDLKTPEGHTLRVMKNRDSINLIEPVSGSIAGNMNEASVERRYAEEHDLSVGDTVTAAGIDFKVTGIVTVPDYDAPFENFSDTAVYSKGFGLLFVTAKQYDSIKENAARSAECYCYAYRLDGSMTDEELMEMLMELDSLTSFVKREDNVRIAAAAGDMVMNKNAGLTAGVIVMALLTYVISVFVAHQIQRESSVIGALYALGAKKKDLLAHYIALPSAIAFAGGLIGAAAGLSPFGIDRQTADVYAYFSLPDFAPCCPAYLIVYAVAMPPVISAIVNTLVINKKLSQTALSLIKNDQKTARYSSVKLRGGFIRKFQARQMLRELRTGAAVLLCMAVSLTVLMLALDCYTLCENVGKESLRDTRYEYMYTLKYPGQEIPEDAEACYLESLSKKKGGYTLDIMIMGISEDNPYFDVNPPKGKTAVTASKPVAQRYGLKKDGKIILTDKADDMDYVFTAAEVCDYAGGLTLFMDIDSMRELFGREEDYYNCLLSDRELDIEAARLYSVTTREDVERSASVFTELMSGMVITLTAAAIIIYAAVMYLMQGVMIDRASFGISLMKVFGFRTKEVKKLYLDGNALLTAAGGLIGIPLAKTAMDLIFPAFIPNVACGINLAFPWYFYMIIFAGILFLYAVINRLLVGKLNKITPAEVLKNRE